MIKLDFINGLVGTGGFELQFENVAQPVSYGTLARQGFQLEPMARGLIRYQDRLHNYRVGKVCGESRWFLLDPAGSPLDRHGRPNAGWFDSARDAMNAAAVHARSFQAGPAIPTATPIESSDRTAAPGYNRKIDSFRDVA